jgi:hypothetical protein
MAAITTTKNGLWSDTTVWSGGALPGTSDTVTLTHEVTVDGTYEFGTDPASASLPGSFSNTVVLLINSGGSLKASRTTSSQLSIRGSVNTKNGGKIDYGTPSDKIPSGVTAKLILKTDGTVIRGKYGIYMEAGSYSLSSGKLRTRNALLTAEVSVSDTTISLDDITGWEVGDKIVIATTINYNNFEEFTVKSISGNDIELGTVADHTVSASAAYKHSINGPVGNFTSNVIFSASSSLGFWFRHDITSVSQSLGVNIEDVEFDYTTQPVTSTPYSSAPFWMGLSFYTNNSSYGTGVDYINLKRLAIYQPITSGLCFHGGGQSSCLVNPQDFAIYGKHPTSNFLLAMGQTTVIADRFYIYGETTTPVYQISYGLGGKPVMNDCWLVGARNNIIGTGQTASSEFNRCYFGASSLCFSLAAPELVLNECKFATEFEDMVMNYIFRPSNFLNYNILVADCYFKDGINVVFLPTLTTKDMVNTTKIIVANKNADPSQQEIYTPAGIIYRDNDVYRTSSPSLRIDTISSIDSAFFDMSIFAPTDKPVVVSGYIKKNSAYGSSNLPSVTISGLGITPDTFTLSDIDDVWQQFKVQATQTTGTDGMLKLRFTAKSSAGSVWVDDISAPVPVAVSAGELNYWSNGLPVQSIMANFVSAVDVWNVLTNELTLSGSVGERIMKKLATKTDIIALK